MTLLMFSTDACPLAAKGPFGSREYFSHNLALHVTTPEYQQSRISASGSRRHPYNHGRP